MPDSKMPPAPTGTAAEEQMRCLTRRSFAVGAVAALAGLGTWRWLTTATPEDGVPWPLRRMLGFNQGLAESLGSPHHLAPTFPPESVQGSARTNGQIGLAGKVDSAGWRLRVEHGGRAPGQTIPLRDVVQLPHLALVTELKCVEGWSEVMHFGGVHFVDFMMHFGLGTRSGGVPDPQGNPPRPVPLRLPGHSE